MAVWHWSGHDLHSSSLCLGLGLVSVSTPQSLGLVSVSIYSGLGDDLVSVEVSLDYNTDEGFKAFTLLCRTGQQETGSSRQWPQRAKHEEGENADILQMKNIWVAFEFLEPT